MANADILRKDLLRLTQEIAENKNRLQTAASQKVISLLLPRIFNDGLATDGSQIGNYRPATLFSKRRKGQQTAYVNLQDSDVLFRSVQVGRSGNDVVIGVVDTSYKDSSFTTAENAVVQERHFKKDIFAPTDSEVKAGEEAFLKELLILTKQVLK